MSDFEFDLEAELAGIRGRNDPAKQTAKPAANLPPDTHRKNVKQEQNQRQDESATPAPAANPAQSETKPAGFDVKQSQQETPGNSGAPKAADDPVGWEQFKTLAGIFDYVGGARPVRLNPKIRKVQVSGVPEPMLAVIQEQLKEKYLGASIEFPWGLYTVTDKNRVFHSNPSLLRYLLFDSLRDAEGTQVQYAKQWLALQHQAFDEAFRPDVHMSGDELDIYALIVLGHLRDGEPDRASGRQPEPSGQTHQTEDTLNMLNMSVSRVLDKLNEQEQLSEQRHRQTSMLQTVLLLDRMGMLRGGLPKDVGALVRLLELNRDVISETDSVVDGHIQAEDERRKTLARQARLQQMQNRR